MYYDCLITCQCWSKAKCTDLSVHLWFKCVNSWSLTYNSHNPRYHIHDGAVTAVSPHHNLILQDLIPSQSRPPGFESTSLCYKSEMVLLWSSWWALSVCISKNFLVAIGQQCCVCCQGKSSLGGVSCNIGGEILSSDLTTAQVTWPEGAPVCPMDLGEGGLCIRWSAILLPMQGKLGRKWLLLPWHG